MLQTRHRLHHKKRSGKKKNSSCSNSLWTSFRHYSPSPSKEISKAIIYIMLWLLCNGCDGNRSLYLFPSVRLQTNDAPLPLCQHISICWRTLDCMYSLQAMATFHSSVRNGGSYTSEVANHYLQTKGNKLVNTMCSNDFQFRFLVTSSKLCNVPSTVIAKTLQNSSGRSQRTVIKPLISSFGNIPFIGSAVRVKFSHYLALAHSALTSFSLMSSQRLSCSICRSRSLMSPIVTHIGRNCSHTVRTHTHSCLLFWGWEGCRRWHSCLQTDALPSDKDRGSLARLGTGNVAGWGAVRIGKTAILRKEPVKSALACLRNAFVLGARQSCSVPCR